MQKYDSEPTTCFRRPLLVMHTKRTISISPLFIHPMLNFGHICVGLGKLAEF